jgi:hypothetical protein
VYFPRNNTEDKHINFAQVSHEYAKTLLPDFDTLLKIVKAYLPIEQQWYKSYKRKVIFQYEKFRNIIYASNVAGMIEGTEKKRRICFFNWSL